MPSTPTTVKVSPKYQIVIPAPIRQQARIRPGAEFEILISKGGLRLIPIRPLSELRGIVRRDDSVSLRDKGDRF